MKKQLIISKMFQQLIPPLSADEFQQLEENLINDGCRDPICIWNNTIIDGHNRYDLCLRHDIPFKTQNIPLNNEEEAIAWICANQIGRRNITEETRRYLIGKRYEAEKVIGSHNRVGKNQYTKEKEVRPKMLVEPDSPISEGLTARRLGEEYRLSHATIAKYGAYSRAIDTLSEKNMELVPKILSGQTKISQNNVIELSKLPTNELARISKQVVQNDRGFVGYASARKDLENRHRTSGKNAPPPKTNIKNMPVFDPDAEISSLTLTIPSWVSSIKRTQELADFELVSETAKTKLAMMLDNLKDTSDQLLERIRR